MYDSNRCFARSRLYNVILYRLVYCLFDIGLQTIAVTHCSILTFILNDIVLCLNCSTFHLQWYKSCICKHLTNQIYRSCILTTWIIYLQFVIWEEMQVHYPSNFCSVNSNLQIVFAKCDFSSFILNSSTWWVNVFTEVFIWTLQDLAIEALCYIQIFLYVFLNYHFLCFGEILLLHCFYNFNGNISHFLCCYIFFWILLNNHYWHFFLLTSLLMRKIYFFLRHVFFL